MTRPGRRIISETYKKGMQELQAKIFIEPKPELEPYTFLLNEQHRMIPLEKNKYYRFDTAIPPAYNFGIVKRYLNQRNLFVDEAWRFKYTINRNKFIRGKQFSRSKKIYTDLTEQEQAVFEMSKGK